MRMYLAGPISGKTQWRVKDEFATAFHAARNAGHEPVNPLEIMAHEHKGECPPGRPGQFAHNEGCNLRADLLEMLKCDAILLLPGWRGSWGVRLELSVATAVGLRVYRLVDGLSIVRVDADE